MVKKYALPIQVFGWSLISLFGILYFMQVITSNLLINTSFLIGLLLISIGLLYHKNTTS